MTGGITGIDAPFDLPFTAGRIPLLYQTEFGWKTPSMVWPLPSLGDTIEH